MQAKYSIGAARSRYHHEPVPTGRLLKGERATGRVAELLFNRPLVIGSIIPAKRLLWPKSSKWMQNWGTGWFSWIPIKDTRDDVVR